MKIVILGTAYPYRGGLATFNERLARQLQNEGHEVKVYTFTLQYPALLFPGKTQYSQEQPPADLHIVRRVNSCNQTCLSHAIGCRLWHHVWALLRAWSSVIATRAAWHSFIICFPMNHHWRIGC